MDKGRGKTVYSAALEKQNVDENHKNPEKSWKTPKSKKFACPGLYFERLANLRLFQVRRANIGLNFEISQSGLAACMHAISC
jgi:hypothetical protein